MTYIAEPCNIDDKQANRESGCLYRESESHQVTKDRIILSYMQTIEILSGGEYRAPHNFLFIGSDSDADEFIEELAMLVITVTVHTAHGRCWDCGAIPNNREQAKHTDACRSIAATLYKDTDLVYSYKEVNDMLVSLLNWAERRFSDKCEVCLEPGHRPHCTLGLAWNELVDKLRKVIYGQ